MQSHEFFTKCACQTEHEVIELKTSSGTRRVGLVAVLSNEPNLYKPGAFGGVEIEDPWETLELYKAYLEQHLSCDLVLPQDQVTYRHHAVDRVVEAPTRTRP